MSTILHPNHALMMTAKKFLLQCLSQLPADKVRIQTGVTTIADVLFHRASMCQILERPIEPIQTQVRAMDRRFLALGNS